MPYFRISNQGNIVAALANGSAVAGIVPAAAVNFHIIRLILGVNNVGGSVTDFEISVGLNRATARGTITTTVTGERCDPNSSASGITGMDVVYSAQPTLAATDGEFWSFNSRGGLILNFNPWDEVSNVGTANPLVIVQRSGAALPAGHAITVTAEWLE